jgi:hypothetical protein
MTSWGKYEAGLIGMARGLTGSRTSRGGRVRDQEESIMTRIERSTLIVAIVCLTALGSLRTASAQRSGPSEPAERTVDDGRTAGLAPRWVPSKPLRTVVGAGVHHDRVVVKFVERSAVRLRNERLVDLTANGDLASLSALLGRFPGVRVERLFTRPEAELEAERQAGQRQSGEELADLNNYYLLTLDGQAAPGAFVDALNAMPIVELAYLEPLAYPAGPTDLPPATPNFTAQQGYLDPAPLGIDAWHAWSVPGGRGAGVEIVDIEGGWQIGHEDLDIKAGDLLAGSNVLDQDWRSHGTAVLGQLVGVDNAYGITGIASDARAKMIGVQGSNDPTVANAINIAASYLLPGDIILIELHHPGPVSRKTCDPRCMVCDPEKGGQFEFVPSEYWLGPFDAIKQATTNGVIVVAVAGNGAMDLDDPIYEGRFDREIRDSGSIMVAAATSTVPHYPTCWTNYGSRVNSYAWGENVTTTGYGDLLFGPQPWIVDPNQVYTDTFGGTSGAAPIVAGAAAALQGSRLASTGTHLPPIVVRWLLTATGTPQGGSSKPIGTQPDLLTALSALEEFEGFGIPSTIH